MKLEELKLALAPPEEQGGPMAAGALGRDANGTHLFTEDVVTWLGALKVAQKAVLIAAVHDGRMALIRSSDGAVVRVVPWRTLRFDPSDSAGRRPRLNEATKT